MVKLPKSKALRIILGVFFIIIGILGLVLPILQGWLFLILGATFLGWDGAKKLFKKLKKKF